MRAGIISDKEVEHCRSTGDIVYMGHGGTRTVPRARTDLLPRQQWSDPSLRHYRWRLIPEGTRSIDII